MGFSNAEMVGAALFGSASALMIYGAKRAAMLPNAEEQAWLDDQLASPATPSKPSKEEQKWLDAQLKTQDDNDMLDDARQAAFAPGEGSSPMRPKKKN